MFRKDENRERESVSTEANRDPDIVVIICEPNRQFILDSIVFLFLYY